MEEAKRGCGDPEVMSMPAKYMCRGCGETIYIYRPAKNDNFGLPTPSELLARLGISRCPRCGRELGAPRSHLDVIVR